MALRVGTTTNDPNLRYPHDAEITLRVAGNIPGVSVVARDMANFTVSPMFLLISSFGRRRLENNKLRLEVPRNYVTI